ncbi:MAG TPA: molybdate ABC transporter substrate-binding protein [Mycobacteriales bacterium]|jgi:molybdate transport system substrate-binding protein
MKRLLATVAAVAALTLAAACGSSDDNSSGSGSSPSASASGGVSGTVTVFAAASLTESFTTIGKQFEAAHPGTTVKFNFGASSSLAGNINQGAPADVFASASPTNMQQVVDAGGAGDSKTFANNVMEIATPPDNPANITQVTDLAKSGVKVALCQPQVPCGKVAQEVFTKADVTVKPVTEGADVKAVLTTVQLGEVDAGMVYQTDVQAAGTKVKGIEIPADQNASTSYPIAALTKAPNSAGAAAFVDYVLSADGEKVLEQAGFAAP